MVKNMHHDDNKAIGASQELDAARKAEIEPSEEKQLAKSQK